jgi:multiple antibiotic resistance protein
MNSWTFGVQVFVTLFVIMDPPGVVPIYLGLVAPFTEKERRKLAVKTAIVSFTVIISFALFGQFILGYLKISLPAMQGAGGLLLLLVALELLTGKNEKKGDEAGPTDVNVALVPLGTPLLAGPGAIVATIIFVKQIEGVEMGVALFAAIGVLHLVLALILRYSTGIIKVIKNSGVTLIARIAGLLLAAIAVQMIANSVTAFIAG